MQHLRAKRKIFLLEEDSLYVHVLNHSMQIYPSHHVLLLFLKNLSNWKKCISKKDNAQMHYKNI